MEKLEHNESPDVEEAAMEAGFTDSELEQISQPGDTTDNQQPEGQPADNEQQQEEEAEQQEGQEASEDDRPLTRAEIKAIEARAEQLEQQLAKVHDRAFGKIGELQQKIEALKTKTTGLSPRAKERLANEFPELAEMLFDDDGDSAAQQQSVKQPESGQQLEQPDLREELSREFEKKLLKREHKDWEQVVASGEFKTWLNTQPADVQQTFVSTWDSTYVADKLTEYKEFAKKQEEDRKEKQTKQKRLENAITPKSSNSRQRPPGYDLDEENAAMEAAFRS